MLGCTLLFVRSDARHVLLAGHPDYIRPRDLSDSLVDKYGEKHFRISFRRNIYLIYVDIEVADDYLDCMSPAEAVEQPAASAEESEEAEYQQNMLDVNLAEKLLREARLPKTKFQEPPGRLESNRLRVAKLQEPTRLQLLESSTLELPTPGVHRQMILG